ncbi:MAG: hypothetical protein IIA59_13010 [Candidatus Marinimicrobia bacterium]|nr:hypothetical protein [Candidatus Neomarinimicrobiota bacterium]
MKYQGQPEHRFHIPVMGTGHSVDTPIRVAHFGITSVISLVDDILLEQVREYYHKLYDWPFTAIPRGAGEPRAKKTTEYLNTVLKIVQLKMEAIKALPFFADNDKAKYFEMLPDESKLKKMYLSLLSMKASSDRNSMEQQLTGEMKPGAIDVNLMLKLDVDRFDKQGNALGLSLRDVYSSLRGYAMSKLDSSIVFSAGINKGLYGYMTEFKDFYRDVNGYIKKKIILKVSDFRSSIIQGKYLAKKGLEVSEFRVESGLNCGGHAFPMGGLLMPALLKEFKEKRHELAPQFKPAVEKYYEQKEMDYVEDETDGDGPRITVQGGVGDPGEAKRLLTEYGLDRTGWATPFLLVPEATLVDKPTLLQLQEATVDDQYLSDASPLGLPYNNLRNSGSYQSAKARVAKGTPGSPCPKGFVRSDTEFTEHPICLASRQYQKLKIEQINGREITADEKTDLIADVVIKECICDHLGNGALIALGMGEVGKKPQNICPGPNIAWFDRIYTLRQMVDHIYGRIPSLVPAERPHMFLKELSMNVDFVEMLVKKTTYQPRELAFINTFKENLLYGSELCRQIAAGSQYGGENLQSLRDNVDGEMDRLEKTLAKLATAEEAALA